MKKEAEIYAAEDEKKRQLIEAKNLAESLIYNSEKTIKDMGDKISPDLKKEIEDKAADLKKVKESDNLEDIKNKTEDLSQSLQKIGSQMYNQTKEGDAPEAETEENK